MLRVRTSSSALVIAVIIMETTSKLDSPRDSRVIGERAKRA